jgi:hypothetical protein
LPGARARVRNFGASKEIGNIVWLIDAVVRTPSSIMQQVTDLFQREPGLAAVIGALRYLLKSRRMPVLGAANLKRTLVVQPVHSENPE